MKIILVPTDFSESAQWAVEVAAGIAKKAGGEIILLHIIEQPTPGSFNVEGQASDEEGWEDRRYTLELIERDRQQLEETIRMVEDFGVPVKRELRLGDPFYGVRQMITDHKVDLIVMGKSGRSRLEEIIVGSDTEKVVRYAKCPVLTVHEKPPGRDFANIVYATCLNENESEFATVVKNAQQMYQATVHLVRINTPVNFQSDDLVMKVMQDFAGKLKLENYTLNVFSDRSEDEGILHFAASINADLIAMATHGRTGLAHVLLGSIAEDVVKHSRWPVLTYVTPSLHP